MACTLAALAACTTEEPEPRELALTLVLPDSVADQQVAILAHRYDDPEGAGGEGPKTRSVIEVALAGGRAEISLREGVYDLFVETSGPHYVLVGIRVEEGLKEITFRKTDIV